jgi:hypothetical protein
MVQAQLTQEEYDKYSRIYKTYNAAKRRVTKPFRIVTINGKEMQCGPPPNYKMGIPMTAKEIKNFNDALYSILEKAGIYRR